MERRPNAIVRGLYHVFHWIGDFGPIFSALRGFLGRSSMIVVNFLILAGIVIISISHSLELLRYAGLRNGLEVVGVFVWEAAFIYSSIVLTKDFRNGTHGWAPWVGFLAGLSFVITSNYMGMEDNPAGKIIGVSTPFLLLVFKGVLAHQTANTSNHKSSASTSTSNKTGDDSHSPTPADSGGSKREEKREEQKADTSPAPTTAPKELAGDREDRSPSRQSGDDDLSQLIEKAREIMEREGRCGRVRLQRETGASEWECRRALKIIKKGA